MLFKLGARNLKHNKLMNLLTVLQMSATFIILISMISTVISRFTYYIPVKEFLDKKGNFYTVFNVINPDTGVTLRSTDEIYKLLGGEKEITAQYSVWLKYEKGEKTDRFISYDDKYAEIFTPELECGHWFKTDSTVHETIPVVVSQNDYGLKPGDIINLSCFDNKVKGEIIGVLSEDTKIFLFPDNFDAKVDFRTFYRNYSYEREESVLFLMQQKDLLDKQVIMQLNGNVMINYPDSISDEIIENDVRKMKSLNTLRFESSDKMKKNSIEFILSQINGVLPVFICIVILTLVGSASISALSARHQLKNYAVYYICGLKWMNCAWVNFFSSLLCVSASLFLSIGGIFVLQINGLLKNTVIELGFFQISGCIAVSLLYIGFSMILPMRIIGKNTPAQILKSN